MGKKTIRLRTDYAGLFKLEAVGSGGEVRDLTGWQANLIVDTGLNRLGTAGTGVAFGTCAAGSGNTPPANGDTGLAAPLGYTSNIVAETYGSEVAGGYCWRRQTWEFPMGDIVGNVAEVGTFWASAPGSMFSRALVKDLEGNPTTVSLAADEILRVTWEFRAYWPTDDRTGTIVLAGNKGGAYDWRVRARGVGTGGALWEMPISGGGGLALQSFGRVNFGGDLGPITGAPTYVARQDFTTELAPSPYVPGSFTAKGILTLQLAQGNHPDGIKSIEFESMRNGFAYQMGFTPSIPKTADDILVLEIEHTWGRRA